VKVKELQQVNKSHLQTIPWLVAKPLHPNLLHTAICLEHTALDGFI
jgi:hypothetical protein